ncbi:hypothetical protein M0P65_02565 [Candidatus Gracilibacteria bacterium]|nr:hypothetical protein [Candidatus Gracilibacteria bacterium]
MVGGGSSLDAWDESFEKSDFGATGRLSRPTTRTSSLTRKKSLEINEVLKLSDSLVERSFNSIVENAKSILSEKLKEAVRIKKYNTEEVFVYKLSSFEDDKKEVNNRGVKMPFLEEKQVDNPDFEEIYITKEDTISREIKIIPKKEEVELPPEEMDVGIAFADDIFKNLNSLSFEQDYLKHIELFFKIIGICQEILNDKLKINASCESDEEAKLCKSFLEKININPEIIINIDIEANGYKNNGCLIFKMENNIGRPFDIFSSEKDIFPFNGINTGAIFGKRISIKDNLITSEKEIIEYLINLLKNYYEF